MAIKAVKSGNVKLVNPTSTQNPPIDYWSYIVTAAGGTEVDEVVDDITIRTKTPASTAYLGVQLYGVVPGTTLSSNTPGMVPDPENQRFNFVGLSPGDSFDGSVSLEGYRPIAITGTIPIVSGTVRRVSEFTLGSMLEKTHTWLQQFMVPEATVVDKQLFSTFPSNPTGSAQFVRSATHWLANSGLDFTGCVAATDAPQQPKGKRGGILITPRVITWCKHFGGNPVGTKVYFVDNNNVKYERTIVKDLVPGSTDLKFGLLNADLPSEIKVYPLCPDLTPYIGSSGWNDPVAGIAGLWVDAWGPEGVHYSYYRRSAQPNKTAVVGGQEYSVHWGATGQPWDSGENWGYNAGPANLEPYRYYGGYGSDPKQPKGGDSGSPSLAVDEGQLMVTIPNAPHGEITCEGQKAFFDTAIAQLFNNYDNQLTPQTTTEAVLQGNYTVFNP